MTKPDRVEDVDVLAPETIQNWYPTYELLQRECPVYHVPGTQTYFVSRYDEISEVLRKTDVFRRGAGSARPMFRDAEAASHHDRHGWPKAKPLAVNPPEHRRWRNMVDHFFSVAGAETKRDLITRKVNELIDDFVDAGEAEFVSEFAQPLPTHVITTMMGFPLQDLEQLREWSLAWVAPYSLQLTAEQERDVVRQMVDFQHYIADHIADRRSTPRDDVISYLVHTPVDLTTETRPLTDGEIINIVDHLFIGGNETTTFALTSGMWLGVQHPGIFTRIQDDPSVARQWVEEVLRLESPTQGMDRNTAAATTLGGVEIPEGSHIHIRYAAANRDPDEFSCQPTSTSTGPTLTVTSPSQSERAIALAQGSRDSSRRSRGKNSPDASRTSGSPRTRTRSNTR